MEEQVLNHLYDIATSEGYNGSRENFIQLVNNNDDVLKYLHSHATKGGYQGDIVKFTNLVRGATPPLQSNSQATSVGGNTEMAAVESPKTGDNTNKFASSQQITPSSESQNMTSLTEDVSNVKDNLSAKEKYRKISNEEMPVKVATSMSTVADVSKQAPNNFQAITAKDVTESTKDNSNKFAKGQEVTTNQGSQNMASLSEDVSNVTDNASAKEKANKTSNAPIPTKRANSLSIVKNAEGKPDLKLTITESINQAFPEGTKVDATVAKEKINEIVNQTIESKLLPVSEGTQVREVEAPKQEGATVKVEDTPENKLEKYIKEKLASEIDENGFANVEAKGTYEKYFSDYINNKGYRDDAYSGKFLKLPIGNIADDFLAKSREETKVPTTAFRDTKIGDKVYRRGDKIPADAKDVKAANYYGMSYLDIFNPEDLNKTLSNSENNPFDMTFTYIGPTPTNKKEFKTFKTMDGSTLLYHPKSKTILKENKNAPDWKVFADADAVSGRTKEELLNTKTFSEVIDVSEYNKLKKYIK